MSESGKLKRYLVTVTQLKISKPFLKVHVKNNTKYTGEIAEKLKYMYHLELEADDVSLGGSYIAYIAKDRYERCRVIQVNGIERTATLMFVDCGYQGEMPLSRLRPLRDTKLSNEAPFCKEFILAQMVLVSNTPHKKILNFHDMIVGNTFDMTVLKENEAGRYVDLLLGGSSLSNVLISEHPELSSMLKKCSIEKQMSLMLQMKKDKEKCFSEQGMKPITLVESPEVERRAAPGFPCEPQSDRDEHLVRVTEFDDEPFCIFVQFIHSDENFQRFQCGLQKFKDKLESEKRTLPGSAVIAVISGHLHRATVLHSRALATDDVKLIQLMETGQKCVVTTKQLFNVPSDVSIVPSYAKRFRLAGSHKLKDDRLLVSEIEFYFKYITKQKLLTLKVVTDEDNVDVPTCHLLLDGNNVLDICKRYDPHMLQYPKQKLLPKGAYKVTISSAESPKQFFIHPLETLEHNQFKCIEEALRHYAPPVLRDPEANDVCVVKLDDHYMRGIVSGHTIGSIYKVHFVDIGFVDECTANEVKVSVGDLVAQPPLAFRCCLKGFEDEENISTAIMNKFQRICKELGQVQMIVVGKRCDILLVELENSYDGSKIINQLNISGWTEDQPSINTHFRLCELERSVSVCDSICTLTESPTKTTVSENWDEGEDTLTNATSRPIRLSPFGPDSNESPVKEKKEDWTVETLLEAQKFVFDDSQAEDVDGTLTPSKPSEPGPSSKILSNRPSPSSTSGYSSREASDVDVKGVAVIISSVTSPTDFTIQKVSEAEDLTKFKETMQVAAKAQAPLTLFTKDSLCLALNPFDKYWCRCLIVDADLSSFLVSVKCFDDGMSFSIDDKTHLKTYSLSAFSAPCFGTRCSLPLSYPLKKDKEVINYLMNIRNDNLTCEVVTKFDDISFVELFHGGKNVTEILVEKGIARRMFIAPTGMAFINILIDSSKFSIQPRSSMATLNQIKEFTERYRHWYVEDPEEGMLVLGYSKKEECYRRAKILKIGNKTFKVLFIDYGNSEWIETIGNFDNQSIACIPPVAIRCTLKLPPGMRRLNLLAEKKFTDIIEKHNHQVFVRMERPGDDFAVIDVLIEGINILQYLPLAPCRTSLFLEHSHNEQDESAVDGCDDGSF